MNILFVIRFLNAGGVEIVTSVLANKFIEEGHQVDIFAFEKRTGRLIDKLSPSIPVTVGGKYAVNSKNVSIIRSLLIDKKIDIIINQWGLPLIPTLTIKRARKGLNVKLISVYHNDPLINGRIQKIADKSNASKDIFSQVFLSIKLKLARIITGLVLRYNYSNCDRFEVLSPSYIQHFISITGIKDTSKLIAQANPVALGSDNYECHFTKSKEILYVGRVDKVQKQVYRVVETWQKLEDDFPDWNLIIVGDGPELKNLKLYVKKEKINRVSFVGFVDPKIFYLKGSLLMLTSSFEGFPLVIPEAMSFGVIPCCFASFSSVYDIIEDGVDGVLVPGNNGTFCPSLMASKIRDLLDDEKKRLDMSINAVKKSKAFSIDSIYTQWIRVMNGMLYS